MSIPSTHFDSSPLGEDPITKIIEDTQVSGEYCGRSVKEEKGFFAFLRRIFTGEGSKEIERKTQIKEFINFKKDLILNPEKHTNELERILGHKPTETELETLKKSAEYGNLDARIKNSSAFKQTFGQLKEYGGLGAYRNTNRETGIVSKDAYRNTRADEAVFSKDAYLNTRKDMPKEHIEPGAYGRKGTDNNPEYLGGAAREEEIERKRDEQERK